MRSGKMISRLDIYIFRQVLFALVVATGGLTALIWLTQSLRFVDLVVNRGLSFFVFIHLTSLLIPSFVAVILPITTYVVIQFVYQRMATDRELTVMRAAGLSPWALARPALAVALLATLAGYGLSLWAFPPRRRISRRSSGKSAIVSRPSCCRTACSRRCPINSPSMSGPAIRMARCGESWWTTRAIRPPTPPSWPSGGAFWTVPTDRLCVLLDGSRQVIDHQSGRLDMLTFKQNELDLADATKEDAARPIDMSELPLSALLDPHPFFERDRAKWMAEGHRRLTEPLTTLSYAMVGLFSALGGIFRRHGGIVRPLVTVGVMVGLLALGLAFGTLAARNSSLLGLMWLHAIVPGVVCAWLLFAPVAAPVPARPAEA